MAHRDFLSFCTRLKPAELRSLGASSSPLHLEQNATIYEAGEPSNFLFIISRGVVEVVWPGQTGKTKTSCYLSRGDLLGTAGVLTGMACSNSAYAREPVSLLCIPKSKLPDLTLQVPMFMSYLAEELAWQLLQANEAALTKSSCLELSGNLGNFDLVTVFQTVLQSSQDGELAICDPNDAPVAQFYFKNGSPRFGKFGHLLGEEALWQLFLRDIPGGTFNFSIRPEPSDTSGPLPEERSANDLLINALRLRDEFALLIEELPEPGSILMVGGPELQWSGSGIIAPLVEAIWMAAFESVVAVRDLPARLPWCELTIYRTLVHMLNDGHLVAKASLSGRRMESRTRRSAPAAVKHSSDRSTPVSV